MTNQTCSQLLQTLTDQLQDQFMVTQIDQQCVVITPMMYPDNTRISFGVEASTDHRVLITDNGEASDYAFVNGLGEAAIRDRIRKVIKRFDLANTKNGELMVDVSISELADGVFRLATAVQDVGYLVYRRSSTRSQRKFKESVETFLTLSGSSFSKDVSLPGRTGRKQFDYGVFGEGMQQLLLSTFESTSPKSAVERAKVIAFDYGDIQAGIEQSTVPPLVVVVDDTNMRVLNAFSDEVESILVSHVSQVIRWTKRDKLETLLVAA